MHITCQIVNVIGDKCYVHVGGEVVGDKCYVHAEPRASCEGLFKKL
jgi:hypothetical protein